MIEANMVVLISYILNILVSLAILAVLVISIVITIKSAIKEKQGLVTGAQVKIIGESHPNGDKFPEWAKNEQFTVAKVKGNHVLLCANFGWVHKNNIEVVKAEGPDK